MYKFTSTFVGQALRFPVLPKVNTTLRRQRRVTVTRTITALFTYHMAFVVALLVLRLFIYTT